MIWSGLLVAFLAAVCHATSSRTFTKVAVERILSSGNFEMLRKHAGHFPSNPELATGALSVVLEQVPPCHQVLAEFCQAGAKLHPEFMSEEIFSIASKMMTAAITAGDVGMVDLYLVAGFPVSVDHVVHAYDSVKDEASLEVFRALLQSGADPSGGWESGPLIFKSIQEEGPLAWKMFTSIVDLCPEQVHQRNNVGKMPTEVAVSSKSYQKLLYLSKAGAPFATLDGDMDLMEAVKMAAAKLYPLWLTLCQPINELTPFTSDTELWAEGQYLHLLPSELIEYIFELALRDQI